MACISDEEKNCLYDIVRTELGSPIRKIELTNDMLDILLKISIPNSLNGNIDSFQNL